MRMDPGFDPWQQGISRLIEDSGELIAPYGNFGRKFELWSAHSRPLFALSATFHLSSFRCARGLSVCKVASVQSAGVGLHFLFVFYCRMVALCG